MDSLSAFATSALENWIPGLSAANRQNYADQEFQRRMASIDLRLERQKLHREDIRDLVELTVGRMDIYHVVGTLLLTFCISWYTDNAILRSDLPTWFQTLFLISNFAAIGFLIISVWLAMHASIAAHSIGVRLLTNFQRLSIPSQRDLATISVSMSPWLEHFLNSVQRLMQEIPGEPPITVEPVGAPFRPSRRPRPSTSRADVTHSEKATPLSTAVDAPSAAWASAQTEMAALPPRQSRGAADGHGGIAFEALPLENTGEEDMQHFRRFLKEQARWLSYDAFARVCMSLGMNQMLQALSYYILGVVFKVSAVGGICSFCAVKFLSLLLLKLDIGENESYNRRERLLTLGFYMLPPIISGGLMWAVPSNVSSKPEVNLLATVCCLLHAGWLLYIAYELRPDTARSDGEVAEGKEGLPKRMRTVYYLNVVQVDQVRMAEEVRDSEVQERLDQVREAREDLALAVQEAMDHERIIGCVDVASRGAEPLLELRSRLKNQLAEARSEFWRHPEVEEELRCGERALLRVTVWEKAPEILAALESLRKTEVQAWLKDDQRRVVEMSYQGFLQQCKELDLGIWAPLPASADTPDRCQNGGSSASDAWHREASQRFAGGLGALSLSSGEERPIRVDAYSDLISLPQSLWVDPRSQELLHEAPESFRRPTSFYHVLQVTLPKWNSDAVQVKASLAEGASFTMEHRGTASRQRGLQEERRSALTRASASHQQPPSRTMNLPLIPERSTPNDALPGRTVRSFTLFSALWWAVAAVAMLWDALLRYHASGSTVPQLLSVQALPIEWPAPAAFFEISTLQCNGSVLWVGGPYATYATSKSTAPGAGCSFSQPTEVVGLRGGGSIGLDVVSVTLAAVLCDDARGHCDALLRPSAPEETGTANVHWLLTTMNPAVAAKGGAEEVPVYLPRSWRVVSAVWVPCATGDTSCPEAARIAAWDGQSVIVAVLLRNVDATAWNVVPRFRVHPNQGGRCDSRSAGDLGAYHDVVALEFGAGDNTLLVLHDQGTKLDAWDLRSAHRLGQWSLGQAYGSMCFDAGHLMLARPGGTAGPHLGVARLELSTYGLSHGATAAGEALFG